MEGVGVGSCRKMERVDRWRRLGTVVTVSCVSLGRDFTGRLEKIGIRTF